MTVRFKKKAMKLKEDLKVYIDNSNLNNVKINTGTHTVHGLNGNPPTIMSIVPNNDWRQLDSKEIKILIASNSESDVYNNLSIIDLDNTTVCYLKELLKYDNDNSYYTKEKRKEIESICKIFCSQYRILENYPIHEIGLSIKNGFSNGTTIDSSINQYIGLHTDNWDNLPLNERLLSRNRICINLGSHPRYFNFINLSILNIYNMYGFTEDLFLEKRKSLSRQFLIDNPNYPIIRLQINPYQAYIASTDILIHDGSVESEIDLDISYTALSFFKLKLTSA